MTKRLSLTAFFLLLILMTVPAAQAAITALDGFNPDVAGISGTVVAVAVQPSDGKILIGGDFTLVGGVTRNHLARLNSDGSLDTTFNPDASDAVEVIVAQADGTMFVGGRFATIGGAARSRLALLNADGSANTGFTISVTNGEVMAIAVQSNGNVLIGGTFTDIGGTTRNHLARINKATPWVLDTTFDPNVTGAAVYAMDLQVDGTIFIGGSFTQVGGTARRNLARLTTTGSLQTDDFAAPGYTFGASDAVYALRVHPDGDLLIGGSFTLTQGDVVLHNLIRTSFSGALRTAFTLEPNGFIDSIVVQADGRLLVGGGFTGFSVQGETLPRSRIARVNYDTTGSLDTDFTPEVSDGNPTSVYALAQQADGKILVGGSYTKLNGTLRNNLARLYLSGDLEVDLDLNTSGSGSVYAVLVHPTDGTVIVGGDFTAIGGMSRNGIAKFDAAGNIDGTFNPNVAGTVYALARQESDGSILLGGSFSAVDGSPAANIARISSAGSRDGTFNADSDNTVYAVAVQGDGNILIGGLFLFVNGYEYPNMARLTSSGALDWGFDPGPDNAVRAIAIDGGGKILIGGMFHAVKGVARKHLARLDPAFGIPDTFDPNVNSDVYALAVQPDGSIIVGGSFTAIGSGVTPPVRNRIAKLDALGVLDSKFNFSADNVVYGLAVKSNTEVVIAGAFTSVGSMRDHVAKITADVGGNWSLDGTFKPAVNNTLYAAAVAESSYVIGGSFTKVDTFARDYAAMVDSAGALNADFNKVSGSDVYAIAFQPDGKIIIGGNFVRIGGQDRSHIARINIDGTLDDSFKPYVDGIVRAIAVQDDKNIVIGGTFTTVGLDTSPNRQNLARLLPTGALDDLNPGVNGDVHALAILGDGNILVGGAFTEVGSGAPVSRNHLALLNGTTGALVSSFDPNVSGVVNAIAVQSDGRIIIGGDFTTVGGSTTRNGIARLDATGALESGFNPNLNGDVNAIAIQSDGKIVIGGAFTTVGGSTSRNRVARFDAAGALDSGFDPNVDSGVSAVTVQSNVRALAVQADGHILLAGLFTTIRGTGGPYDVVQKYIARVNSAGVLDVTFLPAADGGINAVGLQQDGKVVIGGAFVFAGNQVRNNIARLTNTDAALQTLTVPLAGTSIVWSWGQASPEIGRVTFEKSYDLVTWTPLTGTLGRVSGDWQMTSINPPLPQNSSFYIRAQGYRGDGQYVGSGSIVETVRIFHLATVPVVDALAGASDVSAYYARLGGTVTGDGTSVTFEYGTTASYGTSIAADQSPLSGTAATAVSRFILGLTPSTTYNYRVRGTNSHYTVYSNPNRTFVTAADPSGSASVTVVAQSSDLPKPIPNNDFVESTISGVSCATIHDLNVAITADHPALNELRVTLRHGTGPEIELMNAPACTGANMDLILDDEASPATAVQTATCSSAAPALGGVFVPGSGLSSVLTAFDGDSGAGSWILKVTDKGGADNTGTLKNWGLVFTCVYNVALTKVTPLSAPATGDAAAVTNNRDSRSCAAGCSSVDWSFAPNSTVNLTASGSGNWVFEKWTGSCSCDYSSCPTGVCALTMNDNKTVTAEFVQMVDFASYQLPDLAVYFTDLSKHNPTAWAWDFAGVGSSAQQNPVYSGLAAGTHAVTLAVNGSSSLKLAKDITVAACTEVRPVRVGTNYYVAAAVNAIQDAYNTETAGVGETIEIDVYAQTFTGGLLLDQDKPVAIMGGFGCQFSPTPAQTVVTGDVIIGGVNSGTGSVVIDKLLIQ